MSRTAIARALRPVPSSLRLFSVSSRTMGAGDAGSGFSRPGGMRSGDSFTRREKAVEDQYIQQEERAKLQQIKEKLEQHQQHLNSLKQTIDEMSKEQGGEQH
ncbi:hypothetical protein P152DRAFT_424993, partial [Eremomyces bilateralis CBS 781.70]